MKDIIILANYMSVDDLLNSYGENYEMIIEDGEITGMERKE